MADIDYLEAALARTLARNMPGISEYIRPVRSSIRESPAKRRARAIQPKEKKRK